MPNEFTDKNTGNQSVKMTKWPY